MKLNVANHNPRIGVVGPHLYFESHFPESWRHDQNILCLDIDHNNHTKLMLLSNFQPDITLFFRPELYPAPYLSSISGYKVAILSEPLPAMKDGEPVFSSENTERIQVYQQAQWHLYDWCIYYDRGKKDAVAHFGYPINEYAPLPLDTALFNDEPRTRQRTVDVSFVGKPTPHRITRMDFLRYSRLKFVWIAHGCSAEEMAQLFRTSRLVLNVHADNQEAFEPRINLAAACGAVVLSEPLSTAAEYFRGRIFQLDDTEWNEQGIRRYLEASVDPMIPDHSEDVAALSTRALIARLLSRLGWQAPEPAKDLTKAPSGTSGT